MNFNLPVEIYIRLAGVSDHIPDDANDETNFETVRVERSNGTLFAIATNRKIAAIYNLGKSEGDNAVVHLVKDAALIAQCVSEKPFNSVMSVTAVLELQMVSIKTSFGYNFPGNGGIFPSRTKLDEWRTWGPKEPVKATKGAMSWTMHEMLALNNASMSGNIVFPEFIDAEKPIVVRDLENPNWVGLFMGNRRHDDGTIYVADGAELPDWW